MSSRTIALVRPLPASFAQKALRSEVKVVINQNLAEQQHNAYVSTLQSILGRDNVIQVQPAHELPDSVFVEDVVVVLRPTKTAVGLTIGAPTRISEAHGVHAVLKGLGFSILPSLRQEERLDGGDVFALNDRYFVGLSRRTTPQGAKRFAQYVSERQPGMSVDYLKVPSGLHLKSICSPIAHDLVVVWKNAPHEFKTDLSRKTHSRLCEVSDVGAANCLWIKKAGVTSNVENHLILRADWSHDSDDIAKAAEQAGVNSIHTCNMSELAKADGALTCCSVILDVENGAGCIQPCD